MCIAFVAGTKMCFLTESLQFQAILYFKRNGQAFN